MSTRQTWTSPPPRTEPPEVLIAWAVTCLRENRWRGWHEVALAPGSFVEVLPDGRIATRASGTVEHHATPYDAGLRLAGAGA
jgi:hypothetical protein